MYGVYIYIYIYTPSANMLRSFRQCTYEFARARARPYISKAIYNPGDFIPLSCPILV